MLLSSIIWLPSRRFYIKGQILDSFPLFACFQIYRLQAEEHVNLKKANCQPHCGKGQMVGSEKLPLGVEDLRPITT